MITWLVQANLGHHQDYVMGIKQGCEAIGGNFAPFRATPFSEDYPAFHSQGPVVTYGSVEIMENVRRAGIYNPGVFGSEDFNYAKYNEMLGKKMLNYESEIMSLSDLLKKKDHIADKFSEDGHIFCRPNKDLKEFIGEVVEVNKFAEWIDRIDRTRTLLSPDCKAIVSRPYTLNMEWRIFLVEGMPVGASQYRENGRLVPSNNVPMEVLEYCLELEWTPRDVCVVDICETGGDLYIVEFNSMNSSGFYKTNIATTISKISEYVREKYNE